MEIGQKIPNIKLILKIKLKFENIYFSKHASKSEKIRKNHVLIKLTDFAIFMRFEVIEYITILLKHMLHCCIHIILIRTLGKVDFRKMTITIICKSPLNFERLSIFTVDP